MEFILIPWPVCQETVCLVRGLLLACPCPQNVVKSRRFQSKSPVEMRFQGLLFLMVGQQHQAGRENEECDNEAAAALATTSNGLFPVI